ncbi:MAG TPA: glycerophosphodiester phosphodiesterase family protein [Methylomirabilota bacterium]
MTPSRTIAALLLFTVGVLSAEAATVAVAGGAGGVAGADAAAVRVAAHRGGAGAWPENSLAAFRNALALGADFVETDVHLTRDGDVVVLHDATLDRTTTGHGAVGETERADLAALRLRTRDGGATDEPIPTLAALLDLLRPHRAELLLEIKTDAAHRPYPGIEERVLARLRERGLAPRTIVMAFEAGTLTRIRALDPAVRTALLVGRSELDTRAPDAAARQARAAGATHVGIDHRALTAEVVGSARAQGLSVMAWTVNDEASVRRVLGLGVDVVITDRPDLARQITGARR